MFLLFTTIVCFLFFFGRSTSCSVTSTTTVSGLINTFLPGKAKTPDLINMSSVRLIIR
jgi:hypothetical protein